MSQALVAQMKSVQTGLTARRTIYAQLLPKHVNVDRFIRGTLLAVAKDPKLLACSQESLFQAVSQACQLGLDPSGTLGSAYIIPYGSTATLVPGFRGLIDLARRSGQIVSLQAHVVREGDAFDYQLGDDPKIDHRPNLEQDPPGKLRFVYAVALLKDGGKQREVMSRSEVEAIRKKSRAGKSGPWVDHFDEMAKKTVIRRLVKLLPISTEQLLAQALAADDHAEGEPDAEQLLAAFEGSNDGSRGVEALEAQLDAQDARDPGSEG
jgi:recombination protein RecT